MVIYSPYKSLNEKGINAKWERIHGFGEKLRMDVMWCARENLSYLLSLKHPSYFHGSDFYILGCTCAMLC